MSTKSFCILLCFLTSPWYRQDTTFWGILFFVVMTYLLKSYIMTIIFKAETVLKLWSSLLIFQKVFNTWNWMSDSVDPDLRSIFIWVDTVCKDCLPLVIKDGVQRIITVIKQFSLCIFRPSEIFDATLYAMISNIGNSPTHFLQRSSHTFLLQGLSIQKEMWGGWVISSGIYAIWHFFLSICSRLVSNHCETA